MYKVFIENKPVLFTSKPVEEDFARIETESVDEVRKFLQKIRFEKGLSIVCKNPDVFFPKVFSDHKLVHAAGGAVIRANSLLLIHRLGMWDLPKGKLDEGEEPEFAALREVEEECGIKGHTSEVYLETTWHTYDWKGKPHLKKTDWFLMQFNGEEVLVPQTEEDITEAKWVSITDLEGFRDEMYPSLISVLDRTISFMKNGTVFENGENE